MLFCEGGLDLCPCPRLKVVPLYSRPFATLCLDTTRLVADTVFSFCNLQTNNLKYIQSVAVSCSCIYLLRKLNLLPPEIHS